MEDVFSHAVGRLRKTNKVGQKSDKCSQSHKMSCYYNTCCATTTPLCSRFRRTVPFFRRKDKGATRTAYREVPNFAYLVLNGDCVRLDTIFDRECKLLLLDEARSRIMPGGGLAWFETSTWDETSMDVLGMGNMHSNAHQGRHYVSIDFGEYGKPACKEREGVGAVVAILRLKTGDSTIRSPCHGQSNGAHIPGYRRNQMRFFVHVSFHALCSQALQVQFLHFSDKQIH